MKRVTEPSKLKELYETTYKTRLKHRKMKPELMDMFNQKMELFDIRLEVSKNIKSDNWSEEDLVKVLKSLKKSKSADSSGLIYELFRPTELMLCNKVKSQLLIIKLHNIHGYHKYL